MGRGCAPARAVVLSLSRERVLVGVALPCHSVEQRGAGRRGGRGGGLLCMDGGGCFLTGYIEVRDYTFCSVTIILLLSRLSEAFPNICVCMYIS